MKKNLLTASALVAVLLVLSGCGQDNGATSTNTSQENASTAKTTAPTQADFRLVTSGFDASIDFEDESTAGTLTIINNSKEPLGSPALFTYDPETKERLEIAISDPAEIAASESEERSVAFPGAEAPDESDYIGLELGGEAAGGLYSATLFSTMPPGMGGAMGDNPSTIRPTSGYWSFEMSGETADLSGSECPTTMGGFGSAGQVLLEVTPDGLSTDMKVEGESINFFRPSLNDTFYDGFEDTFPVKTGEDSVTYGTVKYTYNALDQDKIEGKVYWDNSQGCTATYPFAMELEVPTEIQPYIPEQGAWVLSYGPTLTCGDSSVSTSMLFNSAPGPGIMTVTGGGPLPMTLNIDLSLGYLLLTQTPQTNYYSSPPNMFLGIAPDDQGYPIVISGTFQGWAQSDTNIVGHLTGTGVGAFTGCSFTLPFTLQR